MADRAVALSGKTGLFAAALVAGLILAALVAVFAAADVGAGLGPADWAAVRFTATGWRPCPPTAKVPFSKSLPIICPPARSMRIKALPKSPPAVPITRAAAFHPWMPASCNAS